MAVRWMAVAAALMAAASCATYEEDPYGQETIREERDHRADDGIGPPACHPASTDPEIDRDRC